MFHCEPSPKYALIKFARWFTAIVTCVIPALASCISMISRIEYRPPNGTNGLGMRVVNGRRRVPFPPARMTALMGISNVVAPRLVSCQVLRLAEPIDCVPQTSIHFVNRLPSRQRANLAVVADKPDNFGLVRTDAVLCDNNPRRRVDLGYEALRDFSDGVFLSARDVDLLSKRAVGLRDRDEGTHGVRDMVKVPRRRDTPQAQFGFSAQQLRDDGRDHGARRLPRSVGIERPHYGHRCVEGTVERFRQSVSTNLRGAVGRLPLERMLLVDRRVLRRAVYLGCGRNEYPLRV